MSNLHPAFDWHEVARLALASRIMDELEENELMASGLVTYQFSARGHELGQLLISQLLDRPLDAATVYYRSRPFLFGSGLTLEEALTAAMARTGSISDGRDVGVVFNLPSRGRATVPPMAADVGSQFTPAAGWAQSIQYRQDVLGEDVAQSIAVVFAGDGAVASNGFWSSLTMATTLSLPLLFMIEDNDFAISVKSSKQTPGRNIAKNLASFGNLEIWDGSGTVPAETAVLVHEAVQFVREQRKPALLHLHVPRLSGHSSVDNQAYKTETERKSEAERDPIPALKTYLVPALMTESAWNTLVEEAKQAVDTARQVAEKTPHSEPSSVTRFILSEPEFPQQVGGLLAEGIKIGGDTSAIPTPPDPRRINMIEAIRRTLDVEMALNPRCLVFGEDVGLKGGVHAATLGLQTTHGEARVFDTSLSEEGIVGRAVGMAMAGLVPVPEIQFRKYADPATEQINNSGTIRWRSNNKFAAPIILRIPGGYRKIGDPWHSVTSEVTFAHQPGLLFAVPSNAEDTVGLLRTALRGNDPVIFFEHRYLLDASWARRPYPGDGFMLPFGRAKRISEGDSLSVITWGAMVERCEEAAQAVGDSIEIIDLRTLVPWDEEMVLDSVRKTAKVLIVHEDIGIGGFGAEIAATIAQKAFMDLDAPIERVTAPSCPVPFNTGLMTAVIPTVAEIQKKMTELLAF